MTGSLACLGLGESAAHWIVLQSDDSVDSTRIGIEDCRATARRHSLRWLMSRACASASSAPPAPAAPKYCGETGEQVENIASSAEYHWMAGIF